ncbi:6506_t:CDS:2 [Diversispora eburnea]|uniref:6506_t:CDS:1 n=1 Tax=Diversispora eburnea TaxID=1213867 RepID=A0A9N9F5N2_9GLOM|nr:6506_t:CDS:2 [Diversispora eburnea]
MSNEELRTETNNSPNETFDFGELEKNVVFCIENLSSCIRTSKDIYVNESTEKIKVERFKFHEFAEESITISYAISSYARDLENFSKYFNDLTIEDILDELNDLSQDARKNADSCKKMNDKVNEIKRNLIAINNSLQNYRIEVETDIKKMKSDTQDERKFNEIEREFHKEGIVSFIPLAFIGGAAIAASAAAAPVLVPSACAMCAFGSAKAIVDGKALVTNYVNGYGIDQRLKQEQKELIELIKKMDEGLKDIGDTIQAVQTYWERHSNDMNHLNSKVSKALNKDRVGRLIKGVIKTSSERLVKNAETYSGKMRAILTRDQMTILN